MDMVVTTHFLKINRQRVKVFFKTRPVIGLHTVISYCSYSHLSLKRYLFPGVVMVGVSIFEQTLAMSIFNNPCDV